MKNLLMSILLGLSLSLPAAANPTTSVKQVITYEQLAEVEANLYDIACFISDAESYDFKNPEEIQTSLQALKRKVKDLKKKERKSSNYAIKSTLSCLFSVISFGVAYGTAQNQSIRGTSSVVPFVCGTISLVSLFSAIRYTWLSNQYAIKRQELHNLINAYNRLEPKREAKLSNFFAEKRALEVQTEANKRKAELDNELRKEQRKKNLENLTFFENILY